MDLYLIRHTRVKVANGVCYGQSDIDIADSFEMEVKALKEKFSISPEMNYYSSPMKRCVLLSEKIASKTPIIDNRLLELNFGDWELKEWESIDKEKLQLWANDYVNNQPPNGESYLDLYSRNGKYISMQSKLERDSINFVLR